MANFLPLRFIENLVIFFFAANLIVFGSTNKGKEQCIGKYQIDVDFMQITKDSKMVIKFNDFDKFPTESILENNGHVLKIELKYNDIVPTIDVDFDSSLGVVGTFRFKFLYFQWFKESSERFYYNNISFPAEINAVFYDVKAKDYDHAVALGKSVIVVSHPVKVHPVADKFIILRYKLKDVRQPNSKTLFENVRLKYWIHRNVSSIGVYEGTFLEFPCQGTVIWVDIWAALRITEATIKEFQTLKADEGNLLMEEFRETTKPNGMMFLNDVVTGDAKKNHFGMPGLIIGVLLMIFCLF